MTESTAHAVFFFFHQPPSVAVGITHTSELIQSDNPHTLCNQCFEDHNERRCRGFSIIPGVISLCARNSELAENHVPWKRPATEQRDPRPLRPGRTSHGPWRAACSTDVDREDSTSVTSKTNPPGNARRGLSVGNSMTYGENSVLGLRQQEQLIKSIQEPDTSNCY